MALVVVLVLVSILGVFFGMSGGDGGLSLVTASQSTERNQGYFVAQGALQRALTELRIDPTWTGAKNKRFPGGAGETFDVSVITNTGTGPMATPAGVEIAPDTTLVLATGRVGNTERQVAGLLTATGTASPGFAALSSGDFKIYGGRVNAFSAPNGFAIADLQWESGAAQVGSLDSEVLVLTVPEDLPAGIPERPAKVDGTIASDQVDGDASTPEPGTYYVDPTSSVKGETKLDAPPSLTFEAVPAYAGGPNINLTVGEQTLFPGQYNDLTVKTDAILTLESGDYYFNNLRTYDEAKVKTNGPVRIFVKRYFATNGISEFNSEGDPRDCEVIATGLGNANSDTAWVSEESHVWARIQVPRARLVVSGTLYGDARADAVSIYGDPDDSGVINYFTELSEDSTTPVPTGGDLVYSSTWLVK